MPTSPSPPRPPTPRSTSDSARQPRPGAAASRARSPFRTAGRRPIALSGPADRSGPRGAQGRVRSTTWRRSPDSPRILRPECHRPKVCRVARPLTLSSDDLGEPRGRVERDLQTSRYLALPCRPRQGSEPRVDRASGSILLSSGRVVSTAPGERRRRPVRVPVARPRREPGRYRRARERQASTRPPRRSGPGAGP